MMALSAEQIKGAVEVMKSYLEAPRQANGLTPLEEMHLLDRRRVETSARELLAAPRPYLRGEVECGVFKTQIDGINKRSELWGFQGAKGQMFFNMSFRKFGDRCSRCSSGNRSPNVVHTSLTKKFGSSRVSRISRIFQTRSWTSMRCGPTSRAGCAIAAQ